MESLFSYLRRSPRSGGWQHGRHFRTHSNSQRPLDLLLVCSSGGHLLQLAALRPSWEAFSRVWVTFDRSDSRSLLREERVVYAYGPTNRSVKNLLRNLLLAWGTVARLRPRVILTT